MRRRAVPGQVGYQSGRLASPPGRAGAGDPHSLGWPPRHRGFSDGLARRGAAERGAVGSREAAEILDHPRWALMSPDGPRQPRTTTASEGTKELGGFRASRRRHDGMARVLPLRRTGLRQCLRRQATARGSGRKAPLASEKWNGRSVATNRIASARCGWRGPHSGGAKTHL